MKFQKPAHTKERKYHRKSEKQKLRNQADNAFSHIVRERNFCELKGRDKIKCGGNLQCMHIITRSNKRLRYEELNALCGCAGHHVWYTHHPEEWFDLVEREFPFHWAFIQEHKNEKVKTSKEWYSEWITFYNSEL